MPSFERRPITRVVKLLISAVFFAAREAGWAVMRVLGHPRPGFATVIYYHRVPARERARFARQMDHMLRWAAPVRPEHDQPLGPGEHRAMVTADDGWMSFVENALPELRQRNIPAAIFVIAGRLGDAMGQDSDHIVTERELLRLAPDIARGLCTIGSHTSTHAYVTRLDHRQAWDELAGSRARLRQILGREVNLFCFPFGIHSAETVSLCRAAGYKRVFSGLPAPALRDPEEFLLGRVRVDPDDWMMEFHLKLMGAYDWVPRASNLKRRVLRVRRPHGGRGAHAMRKLERYRVLRSRRIFKCARWIDQIFLLHLFDHPRISSRRATARTMPNVHFQAPDGRTDAAAPPNNR